MSTRQNPLSLASDDGPSALTQIADLLDAMDASVGAIRTVVKTTGDAARARQALAERDAELAALLRALGYAPDAPLAS